MLLTLGQLVTRNQCFWIFKPLFTFDTLATNVITDDSLHFILNYIIIEVKLTNYLDMQNMLITDCYRPNHSALFLDHTYNYLKHQLELKTFKKSMH